MSRTDSLAARLEEAFRTSRFHSFMSALAGVTEEQARWTPPLYRGFQHMDGSILNLAFHCGGDKHVLMSHSFGDGSVTWPVMTQRFQDLGGDLRAARILAETGHTTVLSTLRMIDEGKLDALQPYYGGRELPAHEIFAMAAEHDLYHAGQINYVRNLLAGGAQ